MSGSSCWMLVHRYYMILSIIWATSTKVNWMGTTAWIFLCHHLHRRAKFLQSQLHASLPHECPGGTTQNFCDFLAKPVCSGLTKGCHRNMEMFNEINRYTVWYTYNYKNNTWLFRSKLYHRSYSWKVGFYGWTDPNLHRANLVPG